MQDHEHATASEQHRQLSVALAGTAAHGWACVMAHYAAYHTARWALLLDERFTDLDELKALNPHLTTEDRYVERHHARGRQDGSTGFGVNHLVRLLYPAAARPYEKLYQASIEVRYGLSQAHLLPPADRIEPLLDEVCVIITQAVAVP